MVGTATQVKSKSAAGASPRLKLVPTGEQYTAGAAPDAGLAAAQQLRASAIVKGGNPLDQVPTSLIPNGTTNYHAVAKILIITKDLGDAQVSRTPSQINVHTSQGDAVIKQDAQKPNLVDVSVPGGGGTYQATLNRNGGGLIARTLDGKTVTVTPDGSGMDIQAKGFPQVPSSAKVILTRK
ncbi:MAG TPA: hypothetical protein VGO93_10565 [Candidatus Xenobia bacterium]|jgi:hypothetical protein